MNKKDTPCNSTIEQFSFEEVERIVAQQGTKDELERQIVAYMNRFFAVVKGTTATYVEKVIKLRQPPLSTLEVAKPQPIPTIEYVYRTRNGFREALANKSVVLKSQRVQQTGNRIQTIYQEETINLYDLWTKSKYRCEYDRLAFTEHDDPRAFNTFHGLAVQDEDISKYKTKDVQPWLDHIYEIWCKKDDTIFDYVIKRLALLVQRPFYKAKVAMVLSGKQGAGKGSGLAPIQSIFGKYFKALKPEHVLGQFNESLSDCLVLFLDECGFSKTKKGAAQLKTLITEHEHHINPKHLSGVTVDNCINLFLASNERQCAYVEESDRRYLVLEMDNKYAGKSTKESHAYFSKLGKVPYQAVYKYLMEMNLKDFVPTIYPMTEATRNQKLYSMDTVTAWVHESLQEGADWTKASIITRKELYELYDAHVKLHGQQRAKREASGQVFKQLEEVCGAERVANSRVSIALPGAEKMKEALRTYLNDPEFPI